MVIYHDSFLEGQHGVGTVTSDIHPSVVSPERDSVCVDGPVSDFKSMRAHHTVVRDTLVLLDRRVDVEEERLNSWVRMCRIDTSHCTWLPMK